ncbi:MAG: diguanylate cyclase [Sulfurimonas sp.]|uniref:diguanylate cyclase n=1 Tax=Sulfurimonas sp. TaxID=2022749 RepID=UPI0025F8D126|nr:diguanylate cyclase [Sulfurimonas sp.]MCK9491689.1 diguanylate cyclase [Sulfurimonas sp.]
MNKKFNRDFLKILLVIVTPILTLVMLFSFYLFDKLIYEKKNFLLEKTYSMASMISNVATFDKEYYIKQDFNNKASNATIFQVQKTFNSIIQVDLELEYLLGVKDGKYIKFLAYSKEKPPNIEINNLNIATPMRNALEQKSGVGVEYDYKGQKTLASYTPIKGTNWGLVVEQPYSLHMKPLYQTAIMSTLAIISFIIFLYFILKRYEFKKIRLIEQSEHRFQQLVESSDDLVWEIDEQAIYTYVSPQSEKIIGFEPSEIIGKKPFDFMNKDEAKRVSKEFFELSSKREKIVNLEHTLLHKNGKDVHILTRGSPFCDEKGNLLGYRGIDRDITLMKIKLQEIEHLAFYDTLTGLANRQNVYEKISQEINYAKRNNTESALLFVDLDDFKIINDTQGHDHGDEVLKSVANRLLNSIRSFDVAGRIGGDEFVVLVRGQDKREDNFVHFDALIERILQEINKPIIVKEYKHQVRASIGVAIIPRDGNNLEEILKCADRAMYEAKKLGKNRVVFHKN